MRLIDFGAVIGLAFAGHRLLTTRWSAKTIGGSFGFIGIALLFIYLTLETNTVLYSYLRGMHVAGVSILWSLFALALLLRGIGRRARELRYLALGLFTIVAFKVFFVDLAHLSQFYRIIAFIILGGLVLSGSFLYLHFRESFAHDDPELPPGDHGPGVEGPGGDGPDENAPKLSTFEQSPQLMTSETSNAGDPQVSPDDLSAIDHSMPSELPSASETPSDSEDEKLL